MSNGRVKKSRKLRQNMEVKVENSVENKVTAK
jgi:hypothetical protein